MPAVEAGSTQNLAGMLKASHSVVHECLLGPNAGVFTSGLVTHHYSWPGVLS